MLVSLFSVNGMGQKGKCTNFAKLNMAWNENLRFLFLYTLLYIGGVAHAFRADSVEVSL